MCHKMNVPQFKRHVPLLWFSKRAWRCAIIYTTFVKCLASRCVDMNKHICKSWIWCLDVLIEILQGTLGQADFLDLTKNPEKNWKFYIFCYMNLFKLRPTHNYLPFHSTQCQSVTTVSTKVSMQLRAITLHKLPWVACIDHVVVLWSEYCDTVAFG